MYKILLRPKVAVRASRTLNFVLTGQVRSGSAMVHTALAAHSRAYCHGDLLNASDAVRKAAHLAYFGVDPCDDRPPDYCEQGHTDGRSNPERYLSRSIFDRPLNGEAAIGVRLLYPDLRYSDLWAYLEGRYKEGDFCCIHVTRNPLATYVSLLQAERDRYFSVDLDHLPRPYYPSPARIDPDVFIAYCRQHESDAGKITQICPDVLRVAYRDLVFDFDATFARICRYLEVPHDRLARPQVQRLRNRPLKTRITNFDALRQAVPQSMRHYFQAELI